MTSSNQTENFLDTPGLYEGQFRLNESSQFSRNVDILTRLTVSSCLSVQPVQLTMSSDWIILAAAFVSSIGLIALLQWIYRKTSPFHTAVNKIPGPIPLPVVGNVFDLLGGFDRNKSPMKPRKPT